MDARACRPTGTRPLSGLRGGQGRGLRLQVSQRLIIEPAVSCVSAVGTPAPDPDASPPRAAGARACLTRRRCAPACVPATATCNRCARAVALLDLFLGLATAGAGALYSYSVRSHHALLGYTVFVIAGGPSCCRLRQRQRHLPPLPPALETQRAQVCRSLWCLLTVPRCRRRRRRRCCCCSSHRRRLAELRGARLWGWQVLPALPLRSAPQRRAVAAARSAERGCWRGRDTQT
jgi:hypothetical protein